VSGDPPTQGPYPSSTAVFDIDSIGLTNVVAGLNRGLDPGESSVGAPTRFVIGVAANPGAVDLEREVNRFMWKVDAGAEFAITQPVFDPEALDRFLDRVHSWAIPVLASLWPLRSLREAEFLANEVPGVVIPEAVFRRVEAAEGRGSGEAALEGIRIAAETVAAIRNGIRGIHLHLPGGDLGRALSVFDASGESRE
jgi:homocysteine S-methyltransferase